VIRKEAGRGSGFAMAPWFRFLAASSTLFAFIRLRWTKLSAVVLADNGERITVNDSFHLNVFNDFNAFNDLSARFERSLR